MAAGRHPTTDSGTVVLHAILVISFLVLVFTGLRIATDDPQLQWISVLSPILPVDHVWFRHLAAALVFTAALAAYVVYLVRARLTSRVRFDAARLVALLRPGKPRWAASNIAFYWGLMLGLLVEIVTGTMMFVGTGGAWHTIHVWTNWICIGLVFGHVACHAAIGGIGQLTRVVRPTPLVIAPPPPDLAELLAEQLNLRERQEASTTRAQKEESEATIRSGTILRAHPAATAFAAAMAFSVAALGLESATRPVLRIAETAPAFAPILDGDLSDPVWTKAPTTTVVTSQGGDFLGTGQSTVDIRAVHDGTFVYFALVWEDPTRSLKHMPLVKTAGGWKFATKDNKPPEDGQFQEDKLALLFTRAALPLIGAAIHLASSPLDGKPASSTGRGLHYTQDGSIADVWVWRASHGGLKGHIDNAHFGGAAEPTAEQLEGRARYTGGFALDPGPTAYRSNVIERTLPTGDVEIIPRRLPKDLASTRRGLGRILTSADQSDSEGARWWMTEADSSPYGRAGDDKIPIGAVIPGVVMTELAEDSRNTIRGVARWAAGRWTLEIVRRLYTGSTFDTPVKTGTLMWVAAFDHSEVRHTRHLRPLRLEVD